MRKEEGRGAQAHGDISWEATGSSERNSGSRRRGKEEKRGVKNFLLNILT